MLWASFVSRKSREDPLALKSDASTSVTKRRVTQESLEGTMPEQDGIQDAAALKLPFLPALKAADAADELLVPLDVR